MSTTPRPTTTAIIDTAKNLRGRLFKRVAIAALLGGIAITAGATAIAQNTGFVGWHHGGAMTAQDMSTHIDKFLQHVYIEIDATPAQQAQLDPIVKQAVADLMPLRTQAQDFHAQALALLTADRVDRAAIETMRADHLRAADQASRRIAQLLGDVAEVLTPAQRKALAARIAEHHAQMHD
jgi:Spy/CpxP family protein refolding chaperone